jgi:hypothetical protein
MESWQKKKMRNLQIYAAKYRLAVERERQNYIKNILSMCRGLDGNPRRYPGLRLLSRLKLRFGTDSN